VIMKTRRLGIRKGIRTTIRTEIRWSKYLFPKEAFPRRESGSFEQGVLQDRLNTTERLDDICAVGIHCDSLAEHEEDHRER
jgi:hypothetical protein